jgi:signal transduction histidine kinase
MIAGGCLLIGLLYLLFLLRTQTAAEVLQASVLLRFPFLVGIATFYGHLVAVAKRERRAAEMARVRERARTDFLATLTHDVRTPLAAAASLADLLLEDGDTIDAAERRQILADIKKSAMEGIDLVGSFLAIASTEAGKGEPRAVIDLNAIVRDVVRRHRALMAEKDVRFFDHLDPALPPIAGDRVQLARAIANLLSNAIKFVDRGGRIEIVSQSDGRTVSLDVRDDGPGIPAGVRDRLFEPYVSDDDRQPGTGLGLFIVRLVAEAHGGSIRAAAGTGKGARFLLQLPVASDVPRPRSGASSTLGTRTVAAGVV